MGNVLTDTTVPSLFSKNTLILDGVLDKVHSWGALMGGIVYNGGAEPNNRTYYTTNGYRWSVQGIRKGLYRINHNIGHTNYSVQFNTSPHDVQWNVNPYYKTKASTYFEVYICNANSNESYDNKGRYCGFSFVVYGANTYDVAISTTRNTFESTMDISYLRATNLVSDNVMMGNGDGAYVKSGVIGIYICNGASGTLNKIYEHPNMIVGYQRMGQGHYRINHNLNHTAWSATAVMDYDSSADYCCIVQYNSNNAFDVHCMHGRSNQLWRDRYVYVTLVGEVTRVI